MFDQVYYNIIFKLMELFNFGELVQLAKTAVKQESVDHEVFLRFKDVKSSCRLSDLQQQRPMRSFLQFAPLSNFMSSEHGMQGRFCVMLQSRSKQIAVSFNAVLDQSASHTAFASYLPPQLLFSRVLLNFECNSFDFLELLGEPIIQPEIEITFDTPQKPIQIILNQKMDLVLQYIRLPLNMKHNEFLSILKNKNIKFTYLYHKEPNESYKNVLVRIGLENSTNLKYFEKICRENGAYIK
ncbi:Hypothetical_protein [Hexamita inflata]|uniref:Hypothetical_protein n=1 Tax=Hexamita inflata TaxID=28002 RepID=A0AA86S6A4_9EUKA|nr:Hypothetical protein HINF_LOCUS66505 [Hexamita inflata]